MCILLHKVAEVCFTDLVALSESADFGLKLGFLISERFLTFVLRVDLLRQPEIKSKAICKYSAVGC